LFWGSIVAALVLKSWYALLLFPAGAVLWAMAIGQMFSLRPTDPAAVSGARRSALLHVVGAVLLIGGAIYLFGEE
jgi:hypothetical protein